MHPLAARGEGSDPWIDGIARFAPGESAGFGAAALPWVVLGPPRGGGLLQQSLHVVSVGHGGTITLVFRDNVVVDEPGDDLVVYENAFHVGSETGPVFTEVAMVEVSADGKTWAAFPYDAESLDGLAGREPVLSRPANGIDPLALEGGGDRFDLADVGLSFVRFVRLTDGGDTIADAGNLVPPAGKGGFDLDAMAALHSTATALVTGTVTSGGQPVAHALVKLVPSDGTRTLRRRTRADGTFRVWPVLPSGEYTVVARRFGVGRDRDSILLDPDSPTAAVELDLH
jgi:hypothetical protein